MNLLNFELKKPRGASWHFVIEGEPIPCERARITRGGAYLPTRSREAQNRIAWAFKAAFPRQKCDQGEKLYGARIKFFHTRAVPGDRDNLEKQVFDAMKGVLWKDDKVVREGFSVLVPNHRARTEILLYELEADYLAAAGEDS